MVNNWPAVGSVVEEKVSFLKRRDKHIFIYHLESHKPDLLPRKTAMLSVSIGFLMIGALGGLLRKRKLGEHGSLARKGALSQRVLTCSQFQPHPALVTSSSLCRSFREKISFPFSSKSLRAAKGKSKISVHLQQEMQKLILHTSGFQE